MLVRGFAVRVDVIGCDIRDGQQVDVDAVGNQAGLVTQYLAARPQIGDIGDTQATQLFSALIGKLAQLTGPEQPTRPQCASRVGDVAKVPGSL